MATEETIATLPENWREWLKGWSAEFDPSLRVILYEYDGDGEDVFEPGPHLAIRNDAQKTVPGANGPLVWPVDIDGWKDIRVVGWQGIIPLIEAGKRY